MMRKPGKFVVGVCGVAAAAASLYFLWPLDGRDSTSSNASSSSIAAGQPTPQAIVATTASQPGIGSSDKTVAENPEPKKPVGESATERAARIDQLINSKDPKNSFLAFKEISACALAREGAATIAQVASEETKKHIPSVDSTCLGISAAHLATRSRLAEEAANAQVPGAAVAYLLQGPDGRPVDEVWNDPAYAAWRQKAIGLVNEASSRGDLDALRSMSNMYGPDGALGFNPELQLKYWVAYLERARIENPSSTSSKRGEVVTAQISKNLTADQIKAAVAAGHSLANNQSSGVRN